MRGVLLVGAALLMLGGSAAAESKVLSGVPAYFDPLGEAADPPPTTSGPESFAIATLGPDAGRPLAGANPLTGAPEYTWWYGCSPTSAGMMIGYWDGIPGRENLFDGNARVWYGTQDYGTRAMVASRAHITAGSENGYRYGDWHNSTSYPTHETSPDCVADFIRTVNAGTLAPNIATGLEAFCEWDNPATALREDLPATAVNLDGPYYGGMFTYGDLQDEIDAGRAVLLDVVCPESDTSWVGHSIVAYGYRDAMFQVKVPDDEGNIWDLTVAGIAVRDTWANGSSQSEWVDWDWEIVTSVIDEGGVEWWPFVEFMGSGWIYTGEEGEPAPLGPYDWMVTDAVLLNVAPEPATLAFVLLGGLGMLIAARRRRHG